MIVTNVRLETMSVSSKLLIQDVGFVSTVTEEEAVFL